MARIHPRPEEPARIRIAVTPRRPLLHVFLFLLTALTTTIAGAFWEGLDPFADPAALLRGLSFSVSVVDTCAPYDPSPGHATSLAATSR